MPRQASPETQRAVRAYGSAVERTRAQVEGFVSRVWGSLDSYRDADINRFVSAVVPMVLAGERQVISLTDAYLATLAADILGQPARPAGLNAKDIAGQALRGVEPTEVYRRPGVEVWTALAANKPLQTAVSLGLTRALSLARTDLQLAKTHAARAVFDRDNRVVGFRRVLSGREDCGLCVVASTQRYHRGELLPIHPGCDCGVEPIYGTEDPGQVIDPETLEGAHDAIAERFGEGSVDPGGRLPDYRKVLLVREHGEIGPMLTVKGQDFTGPADL